jgi:serine/threonine protein kinase
MPGTGPGAGGGDGQRFSLADLTPVEKTRVGDDAPPPLPPPPELPTEIRSFDNSGEKTQVGKPPARTPARTPRGGVPHMQPKINAGAVPIPAIPSDGSLPAILDNSDFTPTGTETGDPTMVAGRYIIEEAIGEGGMGRIFRVRHRRLHKEFALKLMRTAFSGDQRLRALFYREARLASSLSHPNIVSVIDFGEDSRLGAFMVMELLSGESLSKKLRQDGRLPLTQACEITLQMAEALHYIHQRQVVHCDIKADNILLCPVPGTDRRKVQAKLLDFGLARMNAATNKISARVDGTPEYMAPERIRGNSPVPSMDIYGLGILIYEMLTGRLPFRGSVHEVMDAHLRKQPIPPSKIIKEGLDERAEALVLKALAKKPDDRQKDMAAFIYELRTLMDMLGIGRRRNMPRAAITSPGPPPVDRRKLVGAALFELSPIPMAAFDIDQTMIGANRAFLTFLAGSPDLPAEMEQVVASLCRIHPGFAADLKAVHAQGTVVQRTLRLRASSGDPVNLMLWMVPGKAEAGEVHVAIHSLDVPDEDL